MRESIKTARKKLRDDFLAEVQALAKSDRYSEIRGKLLDGIDTGKSYPAGTCATYRGGTIKAIRDTDAVIDGRLGKAGWEVILDGVAELVETQSEDPRTGVWTETWMIVTTSGRTHTRTITMPGYRGDYVPDAEYVVGDVVTHSGKLWICHTPGTEPGGDGWDEWRPDEAH